MKYMVCSKDLEEAHVVIVLSVKKQDLEVAVDVRAVAVHLAIHLVAFPRLLLMTVVDAEVRAQTHCSKSQVTYIAVFLFLLPSLKSSLHIWV